MSNWSHHTRQPDKSVDKHRPRRVARKRREFGQSMVEMAVILPLFLAFVLSIIEIGRAWGAKQSMTLAAHEGARVLVLPYGAGLTFASEGAKQQAAIDAVKSYLNNSGVVVTSDTKVIPIRRLPGGDNIYYTNDDTIEQNYSGGKRGEMIGVQVSHPFETPLPFVLSLFSSTNSSGKINMGVTCFLEHE